MDIAFTIAWLHRACLLLGIDWCTPEPSYIADSIMFEKCVPAIEYGVTLDTGGFQKMPEDYALSVEEKSGGNSWIDIVYGIELFDLRTQYQNRDLRACQIRHDEPSYPMVDLEPIYDAWASKQIALGRYIEIPVCGKETEDYYRVFESTFRNANGNHVRIAIWNMQELDFVFMAAGENPDTFVGC